MSLLFDSRQFEYADIQVSVLGATLKALRGIKFKKTVEKEPVYGAGREPLSIQSGTVKYEGSLTVLQSDMDGMQAAAKAAGYGTITDVPYGEVGITVTYADGTRVKSHALTGVAFTEFEYGQKTGDKMQEFELPFLFLRMKST